MRLFRSTSLMWLVIGLLALTATTDAMGFLSKLTGKKKSASSSSSGPFSQPPVTPDSIRNHFTSEAEYQEAVRLWNEAVQMGWLNPQTGQPRLNRSGKEAAHITELYNVLNPAIDKAGRALLESMRDVH